MDKYKIKFKSSQFFGVKIKVCQTYPEQKESFDSKKERKKFFLDNNYSKVSKMSHLFLQRLCTMTENW